MTVGTITLLIFIGYYGFVDVLPIFPELLLLFAGSRFTFCSTDIEFLDYSNIC
jgi:uncharacterized membrane protein YesL